MWQAPAECPGSARVQAEVAGLITHAPRTQTATSPTVVITRVSKNTLQARVSVPTPDGLHEHILSDASCETLTRAAALVVALAIDQGPKEGATPETAGRASREAKGGTGEAGGGTREAGGGSREGAADLPSFAGPGAAVSQQEVVSFEVSLTPRVPERPVLFTREERVKPGEWERAAEPGAMAEHGGGVLESQSTAAERGRAGKVPLVAAAGSRRDRVDAAALTGDGAAGRVGVFVGAAVGLSSGIVPRLAPSLGVHAGVMRGLWCGALRLGFAPAQSAQLEAAGGAGGSVGLALAALEAGLRLRALELEFPVLAGVESGLFLARGLGVAERSTQVSDWLAGYLSPGVSHTWAERLRVFLRVDGLVALRRPRFALEGASGGERVFHQPDRLAARIYLGLDFILR